MEWLQHCVCLPKWALFLVMSAAGMLSVGVVNVVERWVKP